MRSRALESALFVGLAVLAVLPTLLQPLAMVGDGVDAFGTWWFFDWIRLCIEHGGDPSHTRFFFWPLGKDNFAHTGNNFVDAVMSVPLQWAFGARYQPLWIVIVMLGNAVAIRPLARMLLPTEEQVFAASLLWFLNPYTLFEITAGRPTQAMLWYVPLVPWLLLKVAREGGRRNVFTLGVASALVAWVYWYQAIFVAFFCLPLVLAELRESEQRARVLRDWGLALGAAAVIVAPAAIPMARLWGAGATPGGTPEKQSIFALPGAIGNSVGAELPGLVMMEGLAAPMFTAVAWALPLLWALYRRSLSWRWWAALALVVFLGVGPSVRIGEAVHVNVPYMVLYKYVPFFNRLWFPYRFASMGLLAAALLIAASLPAVRARALAVVLGLVGIGQQVRGDILPFPWHDVRCPELLQEVGKVGGGLFFLPFRVQHDGLIWQTVFRLPTFGGMGESAPVLWPEGYKRQVSLPLVRALRQASSGLEPVAPLPPNAAAPLLEQRLRWVVLRRDLLVEEAQHRPGVPAPADAVRRVSTVLGEPAGVDGSLVLWDLRGKFEPSPAFAATSEALANEAWAAVQSPAWMRAVEGSTRGAGGPGGDR